MAARFLVDAAKAFLDRSDGAAEKRADLIARVTTRLDRARGIGYGWDTPAEEARAILPLLPASDAVLFDVGAHHGDWSATILREYRGRVKAVHAFEPAPENCERMISSLIRAEPETFAPLRIWEVAVSSTTGRATLFGDRPGSGLASLVHRDLDFLNMHHDTARGVETITLDQHAAQHGIDRVDFMKMDIEGHELAALEGARELLVSGALRALSFEFGGCNIDSRTFLRDFWNLLVPLGFSLYRIAPGARLLPLRRYTEHVERFATSNYVAARH